MSLFAGSAFHIDLRNEDNPSNRASSGRHLPTVDEVQEGRLKVPRSRAYEGSRQLDAPTPLFSSDRELRLWAFFVLGCLMVLAAVVTQGLQTRPSGAEIAVALGVTAAYLMVLVRMASLAERSHIVEYGVVAVLMYEALTERASQGRRVPVPAVLAVLATSLVGVLDECIQVVVPGRVFDPLDILFNVMAAAMAVAASVALAWTRRRRGAMHQQS